MSKVNLVIRGDLMFNILTTHAQREFKNLFVNNFKSGLDNDNEELLAWQFIRDGGNLDLKNRQNKPLVFYCCEKGFNSILKFFVESNKLKPNATYIVYIDELYEVNQPINVFVTPAQTFHKYYPLNLLEYSCFYGQNKIIDYLSHSPYFSPTDYIDFYLSHKHKHHDFDCVFLALYNQHFKTADYILNLLNEKQIILLFKRAYYEQNFLSKEAKQFVLAYQEKMKLQAQFLTSSEQKTDTIKKKTFKI